MRTRYPLIGFGHRAQVGKDTAGVACGASFIFSFADTIRTLAYRLNPYLVDEENNRVYRLAEGVARLGWEKAKKIESIRYFLQELGTGTREIVSPNIWITPVISRAQVRIKNNHSVAITDVRFPNEAEAIKQAGGLMVRIDRSDVPVLNHPSESALDSWDDWDLVINNEGSLDDFRQEVRAALSDGS